MPVAASLSRPLRVDAVVIGSGFGGSVAALRLAEKGYRVLVLEKGRRFGPRDMPRTNWDVPRWMWKPAVGFRGLFQMRFFRHVTVLGGVGVGGGSLVYANTLPTPSEAFFENPAWAHLAGKQGWEAELAPFYATARRMLGARENRLLGRGDRALEAVAGRLGLEGGYARTTVGVYQGEAGIEVPDPYFGGQGPTRTGCIACGACMLGCRHNAKNSLDKNYLYLAERLGARILPRTEVTAIRPRAGGGFRVEAQRGFGWRRRPLAIEAGVCVLAAGVLGTTELLLRMRDDPAGLPRVSARIGRSVRTNCESLIGVTSLERGIDLSQGVAIGSILHTDAHTHVEPVRYPRGSGFYRTLGLPHAPGARVSERLREVVRRFARAPLRHLRAYLTPDYGRTTQIMLFMQSLEGSLRFRIGRGALTGFREGLRTAVDEGEPPHSIIPAATALAERFAEEVDGVPMSLWSEVLTGAPTTAHILGGACMGRDVDEGVIDSDHRVFGYDGLYVTDGAAVSANPGVNPSLTITALAERAMSKVAALR